jgi:hypothetical protein
VDLNGKTAVIVKTGGERHTLRIDDTGEVVHVRHRHILGPFTPDLLEVMDTLAPILTYICNKEFARLEAIANMEKEALQKSREQTRRHMEYRTLHDADRVCGTFPELASKLTDIRRAVANGLRVAANPRTRYELGAHVDNLFNTIRIESMKEFYPDVPTAEDEAYYSYIWSEIDTFHRESDHIVQRVELIQRVFSGWVLYTNEVVYAPGGGRGMDLIQLYEENGLATATAVGRLRDYNEHKRRRE